VNFNKRFKKLKLGGIIVKKTVVVLVSVLVVAFWGITIYAYDLNSGRYLYQNAVNDKGETCGKCHKDEPVFYHQKGDDTDQWLVSHDKVDEYMTTEFYDEKDHFGYSFSDTESWDLAAYIYYVMLQNSEINEPPTADAGPDQAVNEGNIVILNGSNSSDPDDGIASYLWEQTSGITVTLSDPTAVQPTFTAPDVGPDGASLTFQLTVTDNGGLQDTDTCIVNVTSDNEPPTADAGPDQTVGEGAPVTLDGSNSSDPDDGIASYLWEQTSGITVTLSDPTAVQPTFIAPDVGPDGASLTFQLTVTDNGGLQDTDTCIVNVTWDNEPPTADAGPDQAVNEGDIVILNGSNSSDPDDGIASYQWTQTAGTSITLSDSTVAQPTFTAPYVAAGGETLVFDLTVTDNGGLQDTDTCIVNVIPLSASGTIYGIVTDKETGEPIGEAIISAMCKDIGKKKTSTNTSGHYELTNLEDGKWTVKVKCKGYKATRAIVNVSIGGTYEQNFELLPR
jgi:hypothetical protein